MDKHPSSKAIASHVEGIAHNCMKSLNDRNFSKGANGWTQMADIFRADSEHPQGGLVEQIVEEHLDMQRQIAEEFPEYRLRLLDLYTEVSERAGSASVFMTVEATGIPPGMIRQSIGVSKFRLIDGRWLCVRYGGARGMVGDS